jgi:hypothetical protein
LKQKRPKHPRKELEAVLAAAERKKWRVEKGRKYFKMKCPCYLKHLKTVHISPSDPNYLRNLIGYLERETCWKEQP